MTTLAGLSGVSLYQVDQILTGATAPLEKALAVGRALGVRDQLVAEALFQDEADRLELKLKVFVDKQDGSI